MIKSFVDNYLILRTQKVKKRLLLICSDDWGCERIKDKESQKALVDLGLPLNNRFDKYDTLESSTDINSLCEVLQTYKDVEGNYAKITALFSMFNPDFTSIKNNRISKIETLNLIDTYKQSKYSSDAISIINNAIQEKVIIPELHGGLHINADNWLNEIKNSGSFARKAFECNYMFIPQKLTINNVQLEASFKAISKKETNHYEASLNKSVGEFKRIFLDSPNLFTPPAMHYHPRLERIVVQNNIKWLDMPKFQKWTHNRKIVPFRLNYLGLKRNGIFSFVRNGVFEPNEHENDNGVAKALYYMEKSFKAGIPAILSNHRAAFVGGLDVKNRDNGLRALSILLKSALLKWPDITFASTKDLDGYYY